MNLSNIKNSGSRTNLGDDRTLCSKHESHHVDRLIRAHHEKYNIQDFRDERRREIYMSSFRDTSTLRNAGTMRIEEGIIHR